MKKIVYNFTKNLIRPSSLSGESPDTLARTVSKFLYSYASLDLLLNSDLSSIDNDFSKFADIQMLLKEISEKEHESYRNLCQLHSQKILYEYLSAVLTFYEKRKSQRYTLPNIQNISGVSKLQIVRFENIECIMRLNTFLAINKVVSL